MIHIMFNPGMPNLRVCCAPDGKWPGGTAVGLYWDAFACERRGESVCPECMRVAKAAAKMNRLPDQVYPGCVWDDPR